MRLIWQITVSTIGCVLISLGSDEVTFLGDVVFGVIGLALILGVGANIGRERTQ